MVELLRQAIRTLELDPREVAEAVALQSQLDAHIALAAGEFDAAKLWEVDGEGSLASWLRSHARMSAGGAAHLSKMAQRMREHPVTAEAWQAGGLSTGQVDV